MIVLGIDTTTLACSVALLQDQTLLAEMTLNIKKTHSERLMPLLDRMLIESGLERREITAIAAAAGPGSFTGLRIGISTARALAQGLEIPAVPVCTLEAMAEAVITPGSLICPLLDARRSQAYTALFRREETGSRLTTLLEPEAMPVLTLFDHLKAYDQPVIFLGEGLQSFAAELEQALPGQALLPEAPFRLCRAALVALLGKKILQANPQASYLDLLPRYLRRPEAERLAEERENG